MYRAETKCIRVYIFTPGDFFCFGIYPTLQYPAEQIVYMIEKLFSLERGGSKVFKSFFIV